MYVFVRVCLCARLFFSSFGFASSPCSREGEAAKPGFSFIRMLSTFVVVCLIVVTGSQWPLSSFEELGERKEEEEEEESRHASERAGCSSICCEQYLPLSLSLSLFPHPLSLFPSAYIHAWESEFRCASPRCFVLPLDRLRVVYFVQKLYGDEKQGKHAYLLLGGRGGRGKVA